MGRPTATLEEATETGPVTAREQTEAGHAPPPADPPKQTATAAPDPDPAPPKNKGGRPRGSGSASTGGRPRNMDRLTEQLAGQYVFVGMFLRMASPNAGNAMIVQADECAKSLAAWAETNPKVRKALEKMVNGAGAASVIAAHAPIVFAVVQDLGERKALKPKPAPAPEGLRLVADDEIADRLVDADLDPDKPGHFVSP